MMDDTTDKALWYCIRQRAGPLVKEVRMLRPRFLPDEPAADHRDKAQLKRYQHGGFDRRQVDRLEIRLALIPAATHYTLTYDNTTLPIDFAGVRRSLRAFFGRVSRYRSGEPLDYIYCIEGLHGDHRYHIHLIVSYKDLSPVEVSRLWGNGGVEDDPVLLLRKKWDKDSGLVITKSDGGFRRIAEYLNKERTDGITIPIGRHPWSCSRSLNAKVPPVERWRDTTGEIIVPETAIPDYATGQLSRGTRISNAFGAYHYETWIDGSLLK